MLDAPDAVALAAFYRRLLGWVAHMEEPDWVSIQAPDGSARLSFQTEPRYRPRPGRPRPNTSR